MPELNHAGREAFAQARARGHDPTAAYVAAGYSPGGGGPSRVSGRADVKARMAELRVGRDALRKASLEETVLAILDLATRGDQTTASGRREARTARLDAYRLNGLLAEERQSKSSISRYLPLSHEDWMAEYGHLAHSAK